jgi:pyruvate,water dikinase
MSACRRLLSSATAPDAASPGEVGGKAWNLLRMTKAEFPVPRFWIVPRGEFDRVVERCRGTIDRALGAGAPDDPRAAAEVIRSAIVARALSADLIAELTSVLPGDGLFAVRSSAMGEDSRQHSFAGILDSVLNVPPGGIGGAVAAVWASAFSSRALAYRARKGLPLDEAATAVIVQEMVQPACAGVLFTRDPADGARRMVIAAGLGLGQGVVSDAVGTDTYRIGWDDDVVRSEVVTKRSRIVLSDRHRGGTREERVPTRRRARPALRPGQVRRLRDTGLRLERALGGPQDVEWAQDALGRLFILQARPIVGRAQAAPEPRRLWDNANVVESYPGLSLPLTFSFARRSYERAFERAAARFLALGGARPPRDVYASLVGLLHGRIYYNLHAWYEMFSYLPASDRYRASWDELVGVTPHHAVPSSPTTRSGVLGALLTSLVILLRVKSLSRRFFTRFDRLHARFRSAGTEEATCEELLSTFRALEEAAAGFWHLTIQNDFCVLKYHQWLARLLELWGPGRDPHLVNTLLSGHDGIESVAPIRSLLSLAEGVRADPSCLALFRADDDEAIWAVLQDDPRRGPLREAFARHLEEFGDRSVADLKLETVTFAQEPARLVGLVKHYLRAGLPAAALGRERPAPSAEADPRRVVGGPIRGRVFRFVLDRARSAIRAREDMRLARTRLFGMVRRLFLRLGLLLAEQQRLEIPSDVHYLTVEELLDLGRGTGVTTDLQGLVGVRKADYARHATEPAAPRLETIGIPGSSAAAVGAAEAGPDGAPDAHAELTGTGCSPGIATGRAAVVTDPERAVSQRDCVLVARSTDPGWVYLMMSAAGMVVERGSLLSHTAIIGRELGIPTVVGATGATTRIPDGAVVRLDGRTGEVRWA